MNSAVLILAVCRIPVTYELSKMTLLSMSSCSSVDRAPAPVSRRSWVWFLRGTQIFLCSTLVSCWTFHISQNWANFNSFMTRNKQVQLKMSAWLIMIISSQKLSKLKTTRLVNQWVESVRNPIILWLSLTLVACQQAIFMWEQVKTESFWPTGQVDFNFFSYPEILHSFLQLIGSLVLGLFHWQYNLRMLGCRVWSRVLHLR